MSEELPIGPNRCYSCGGEYGEHADHCKVPKMVPEEVGLIDVLIEIRELRGAVRRLSQRVSELEASSGPIA